MSLTPVVPFLLMKLGAPEFGANMFRLVMSSWLSVSLMRMKYHPSLFFIFHEFGVIMMSHIIFYMFFFWGFKFVLYPFLLGLAPLLYLQVLILYLLFHSFYLQDFPFSFPVGLLGFSVPPLFQHESPSMCLSSFFSHIFLY